MADLTIKMKDGKTHCLVNILAKTAIQLAHLALAQPDVDATILTATNEEVPGGIEGIEQFVQAINPDMHAGPVNEVSSSQPAKGRLGKLEQVFGGKLGAPAIRAIGRIVGAPKQAGWVPSPN